MAATRLIALHKNKGKSVAACLKSRTDYAKNPDKTNKGELVSSYECSPLTADEEFMLSKRQYEFVTGRIQKNDVIAYQIRQSFKPGEITAEEANKVGYELAMRFTSHQLILAFGEHKFFVCGQGAALIAADQLSLVRFVKILRIVRAAFQAGRNRLALVFVQRDQTCCSQFYHLPAKRKCRTMAA